MSEEKVELVRRVHRAFDDRDFPALETMFSEDCVFRLIGGFADLTGAEFRGREAVLDWVTDFVATVGGRFEIEAIREVGDQVLVTVTTRGVGAVSGAGASMRNGQVFSFRGGQISALDGYYSIDDAREAVGIEG